MKLTKNEAEFVIDAIDKAVEGKVIVARDLNEAANVIGQVRKLIVEAINKCTEKEFPCFEIQDRYQQRIKADYAPLYKCVLLSRMVRDDTEDWIMELKAFKKFTEGCNKIAEWLDEQH